MQTISLKIEKEREAEKIGRRAADGDVTRLVPPGTVIRDDTNGKALIVFGRFDAPHLSLKSYLPAITYTSKPRLTQKNNPYENRNQNDVAFGYHAKRPAFNQAAGAAAMNSTNPGCYREIQDLALEMMALYQRHNEETFTRQQGLTSSIHERWKMGQTFFTGGVINDTANLDYHYDAGNFVGCWSAMAVFMRGVEGGHLAIPALDLNLAISDETYVLFDGQSLLHGVLPIKKLTANGRRFSVVFYGTAALKGAGTYEQELAAIRQIDMRKHRKNAR